MKRIRKCRRLLVAFLTAMLCLSYLSMPVWAYTRVDVQRECSLTVRFAEGSQNFSNGVFRIYKVAQMSETARFTLCEPFDKYPITLEDLDSAGWRALAQTLEGYVSVDKIQPQQEEKTKDEGNAVFSGLQTGLYLVVGDRYQSAEKTFALEPFLISLPSLDKTGNQWDYDAIASAKYEAIENPTAENYTSRAVQKIWKDDGAEKHRPENVTVQLLQNGQVYETVTLSQKNNWKFEWDNLPGNSHWLLVEKNVPDGYTVLVEQEGTTFVLTNTYGQDVANVQPVAEELPETGVCWWPVPLLAGTGIVLFMIGWSKTRKKVDDEK